MEKLNLVKILKDCPKGTKFYSPVYGKIEFIGIETFVSNPDPITIKWFKDENTTYLEYLRADGTFRGLGECIIFPSEDQRDWSKWQRPFIDGDIIVDKQGNIAVYKQVHESYEEPCVDFHCRIYHGDENLFHTNFIKGSLEHCGEIVSARFATEEEKLKLFQAIKDNGYKWNVETKTLEKLIEPNFKVGDRIKHRLTGDVYKVLMVLSNGCGGGVYDVSITHKLGKSIDIKEQDDYELVLNKFDISTLIPYESKVLIRNTIGGYWQPAFWGAYTIDHSDGLQHHDYLTTKGFTHYCIPYDGNEHLLGTTDDCCVFYKTWEE